MIMVFILSAIVLFISAFVIFNIDNPLYKAIAIIAVL